MTNYRFTATDTPDEINKILNMHIRMIEALKDRIDKIEAVLEPEPTTKQEPVKPKAKDKK